MSEQKLKLESYKAIVGDGAFVHIDAWDAKAEESVTVAITADDLEFEEQRQQAAFLVCAANAHDALVDRLRGRADRCGCHPEPFNPETDEGRGPGTCAECEADQAALAVSPNGGESRSK